MLQVEFPQIDAVFEAVHLGDEIIEQINLSNILQSLEGIADTGEIVVLQEQYFQIWTALVQHWPISVWRIDIDRAELLSVHLQVMHVSQVLSVLGLPPDLLWLQEHLTEEDVAIQHPRIHRDLGRR